MSKQIVSNEVGVKELEQLCERIENTVLVMRVLATCVADRIVTLLGPTDFPPEPEPANPSGDYYLATVTEWVDELHTLILDTQTHFERL